MKADRRKLIRGLEAEGYTVDYTGGGHFRITHPQMGGPVFTGSSPSCPRSVLNLRAMLKRKML